MRPAEPPPRRRPNPVPLLVTVGVVAALGGIAALVLTLSGGGGTARPAVTPSQTQTPSTWAIAGAITVPATVDRSTESCTVESGYDDVSAGTPVTVTDEHGTTVGAATLDDGIPDPLTSDRCVFPFHLEVKLGPSFYKFEVGRRGGVTYTAEQVRAGNIQLRLGD